MAPQGDHLWQLSLRSKLCGPESTCVQLRKFGIKASRSFCVFIGVICISQIKLGADVAVFFPVHMCVGLCDSALFHSAGFVKPANTVTGPTSGGGGGNLVPLLLMEAVADKPASTDSKQKESTNTSKGHGGFSLRSRCRAQSKASCR